jgi:hypothetical protein
MSTLACSPHAFRRRWKAGPPAIAPPDVIAAFAGGALLAAICNFLKRKSIWT